MIWDKREIKSQICRSFWDTKYSGTNGLPIGATAEWEGMHNVFHVSMLRKYVADPSHVIDYCSLHLENLSYVEQPVQILNRKE